MSEDVYASCIRILSKKVLRRGINYSLENLKLASESIGSPEKDLPAIIHVAGTNGKGSTIAFLNAILIAAGYTVGTFTSPHLNSYCERISIDNTPITEKEFCNTFNKVKETALKYEYLTEFEVLTLMSFLYFKEKRPDIILYETGLGGKLDTTNLVHPSLCILCKIDLDHEAILGNTLSEIAKDKAGIIKKNIPVISTTTQEPDVINVFQKIAKEKNAPLLVIPPLKKEKKEAKLRGKHQAVNASMAITAAKQLASKLGTELTDHHIQTGLLNAALPGRYQKKQYKNQNIILDGAHNPSAITALLETLKNDFPNQKFIFFLGFSQGKKCKEMLNLIAPFSQKIYYCDFNPSLSIPLSSLENNTNITLHNYAPAKMPTLPPGNPLIITGSLYFVGWCLEKLKIPSHPTVVGCDATLNVLNQSPLS